MTGPEFWAWVLTMATFVALSRHALQLLLDDPFKGDDRFALGAHLWPLDVEAIQ
jgi:hypothetical protein